MGGAGARGPILQNAAGGNRDDGMPTQLVRQEFTLPSNSGLKSVSGDLGASVISLPHHQQMPQGPDMLSQQHQPQVNMNNALQQNLAPVGPTGFAPLQFLAVQYSSVSSSRPHMPGPGSTSFALHSISNKVGHAQVQSTSPQHKKSVIQSKQFGVVPSGAS